MGDFRPERMPGGWVAARPTPSPDALARFYADEYFQASASTTYAPAYDQRELAHTRLRARQVLHALAAAGARPGDGPLLDVGCGEGFLLAAAVEQGWDARGVDHSRFAVERFHPPLADRVDVADAAAHLDAIARTEGRLSACVLVNVLEHVPDPAALLGRVRDVLAPAGVALITVPNDDSTTQAHLLDSGATQAPHWFAPPQHLNYFNTETGPAFVRCHGFELVDHYGDFPIEWFLFHPGSNYVADPSAGRGAHSARVAIDLLLADAGITPYHELCRALTACGAGRNQTMVVRPA